MRFASLHILVALAALALAAAAQAGPAPAAALAVPAEAAVAAPAVSPSATPVPPVRIAFRRSSAVRGADYTLGDVAEVTAQDAAEAQRLAALTLGRSPSLGVALPLNSRQLSMALERLGVGAGAASVEYPEQMFVQRDVQRIDAQAFRKAVETAAREQSPLDHNELLLTDVRVPRLPLLPVGGVSYEFSFRFPGKGAGDVSYQAQVLVDGERQASLSGSLHADQLVETVKVQKRVGRGEPLGPDACQVVLAPLSEQRANSVGPEDLEALVAKHDLAAGEVLTWTAVTKKMLVTRGQPVHMILENGGMRIATQGVARASGSRGDVIEVTNSASGAKVQAVVVDKQTVSVSF